MANVARYYFKMVQMHGSIEAAMDYTLEMFEGLTEAQVEYAIREYGNASA